MLGILRCAAARGLAAGSRLIRPQLPKTSMAVSFDPVSMMRTAATTPSESMRLVVPTDAVAVSASDPAAVVSGSVAPQEIELRLGDGATVRFDAVWLAHNCASLKHKATGQRIFSLLSLMQLPPGAGTSTTSVAIQEAHLSPDRRTLHVRWQRPLPSGAVISDFSCAWLTDLERSRTRKRKPRTRPAASASTTTAGGKQEEADRGVPEVAFEALHGAAGRAAAGQLAWLSAIHDHGLCLVTGVPQDLRGTQWDDGSGDSAVVQLGRLVAEPQQTLCVRYHRSW
jgi:hypothetical protein